MTILNQLSLGPQLKPSAPGAEKIHPSGIEIRRWKVEEPEQFWTETYYNIIGDIAGDRWLSLALITIRRYLPIAIQTNLKNQPVPGANDGASGGGLLELVRTLPKTCTTIGLFSDRVTMAKSRI
jgi:hypothetical protein